MVSLWVHVPRRQTAGTSTRLHAATPPGKVVDAAQEMQFLLHGAWDKGMTRKRPGEGAVELSHVAGCTTYCPAPLRWDGREGTVDSTRALAKLGAPVWIHPLCPHSQRGGRQ